MAEDSDLERTEEPTGRRIEQAREQGQVPHSRELSTFLVLIASSAGLWATSGWVFERSRMAVAKSLRLDFEAAREPALMLARLADSVYAAAAIFAPLLAIVFLAALVSPFFLNAWVFAPKAFTPDLSRIDPMAGFGRLFSWNSLVELAKAMLKAALIGAVAVLVIWGQRDDLLGLLAQPLESGVPASGAMVLKSFVWLVVTLAVIVAIDVPFQLWQYFDKLKMSKEEVRQEMKEMQGDPQVKGRIRSLQMQAARRRMMSAVPQADVIVTNPTHYSVALSYKAGMAAPKVIAKGMGELALKIRELGAEHGVPMLEAPPLARALYRHAELDVDIPVALYTAVAEVLAYVFQLSRWRVEGGNYPVPPRDLAIPPELVPEAD